MGSMAMGVIAGVLVKTATLRLLPGVATALAYRETEPNRVLRAIADDYGTAAVTFLVLWFAAIVIWMWNREYPGWRFGLTALGFAVLLPGLAKLGNGNDAAVATRGLPWICAAAAVVLSGWAVAQWAAARGRLDG